MLTNTHVHLEESERVMFDLYFAGIASIAMHPAAGRSNGVSIATERSLSECADIALEMIEIRREVFKQ